LKHKESKIDFQSIRIKKVYQDNRDLRNKVDFFENRNEDSLFKENLKNYSQRPNQLLSGAMSAEKDDEENGVVALERLEAQNGKQTVPLKEALGKRNVTEGMRHSEDFSEGYKGRAGRAEEEEVRPEVLELDEEDVTQEVSHRIPDRVPKRRDRGPVREDKRVESEYGGQIDIKPVKRIKRN
jgi:hypothetical protein